MSKKFAYILCIILGIGVIAGICLYRIPQRTPINVTLEAIKIDENGSEIGTVNISMQGNLEEYIFRDSCLNVEIAPFDGLSDIEPVVEAESRMSGPIIYDSSIQLNYVVYSADHEDNAISLIIFFSTDFERWLILSRPSFQNEGAVYYLGSTSASDSIDDLKDFFAAIIPEE